MFASRRFTIFVSYQVKQLELKKNLVKPIVS
jgi:hypothetical protein